MTASDGRVGYAPFVVQPQRLGEHHVAVVVATNMWAAYNFDDANGEVAGATRGTPPRGSAAWISDVRSSTPASRFAFATEISSLTRASQTWLLGTCLVPGTGRSVRSWREDPLVTREARSERTAKLLIARLDALTRAAGSLPRRDAERLVELATVATMRAVALDLIEAERAEAIWRSAHRRNPAVPAVTVDKPDRLAA